MDVLLQECELFGDMNLDREHCFNVFINAKALDSAKLIDMSWQTIFKEFENLVKDGELLDLDITDMVCLLNKDNLDVTSEDIVIELIQVSMSCFHI